jgi:hypothetical protein
MIRYKSNNNEHASSLILSFSYPSSFIEKQFRKFSLAHMSSTPSSFLPIIYDEQEFKRIRRNILGQPTPQQTQVAISATTADLDNNPTDQEVIQTTDVSNNMKKNDTKFGNKIIVHYRHEKRFQSFKRDMHHIYDDTFQNRIDKDIKMIVGNRNRSDAKKELIRKRPKQSLLKNKTQKSKFFIAIIDHKLNLQSSFLLILSRTKKNIETKTNN